MVMVSNGDGIVISVDTFYNISENMSGASITWFLIRFSFYDNVFVNNASGVSVERGERDRIFSEGMTTKRTGSLRIH